MTELLHGAALICVAAGLLTGVMSGIATRDARLALRVALDFWLAAGLLNLGGRPGWAPVLVAALIIGVRQTAGAGLRRSAGGVRDVVPRHHGGPTGAG